MKTPLEMIVKLLEHGGRVEHKGSTYAMSEDGDVCVVAGPPENEIGFGVDCTVKELRRMAEEIGRDELWLSLCAMQLSEMRDLAGTFTISAKKPQSRFGHKSQSHQ